MPNYGIQTTVEVYICHTCCCRCMCNKGDSLLLMHRLFSALLALSPPGVGMLPLVLVPAMVVVMISAVLCGVICVLYQLRKKEKYISVPVSLCF